MDLEVVGRHALLFDDDSMAAFVNSPDALVEWNSLSIDRYDVRHLLSAPPPPRRRRNQLSPLSHADSSFESELDQERYLDLTPDEEGNAVGNMFACFVYFMFASFSFSVSLMLLEFTKSLRVVFMICVGYFSFVLIIGGEIVGLANSMEVCRQRYRATCRGKSRIKWRLNLTD